MLLQLGGVFLKVIVPVFALVALGYFAGPPLGLDARTLSRVAYFIFVPAFIFSLLVGAQLETTLALRMIVYIVLVHLGLVVLAVLVAKLLGKDSRMTAAFVVIAVFGNVGNFGLPLVEFRLGSEAMLPAGIYFLSVVLFAFVISVTAAGWQRGGVGNALLSVLRTPALLSVVPAVILNSAGITPPLLVLRIVGLLGQAMIPVMVLSLGVQLAATKHFRIDTMVVVASGVRLIGGPLLAFILAALFALEGTARSAGIAQASMPTAVLASIIALEYDLLPDFITSTVLFSTLASVVTL
ncbi:MAG: AEC family transporter, partial [Spirochaetota bacterium]